MDQRNFKLRAVLCGPRRRKPDFVAREQQRRRPTYGRIQRGGGQWVRTPPP